MIDLVKPKLIICMGKSVFDDFLYTKSASNLEIYESSKNNIPVIGYSRKRNVSWTKLLPEISRKIAKKI